jgi:hypothetical protein
MAAEHAATVINEDLEECSSAILNALKQGGLRATRAPGRPTALVAKHKLCRDCFKERHVGGDYKNTFAADELFTSLIIYS